MSGLDGLTPDDLNFLRTAFALAQTARKAGDEPYGAVVVAADGSVLAEARNSQHTTGDPTAHAEINALRLLGRAVPRARLAGATVYASGEPCAMCAGAIFYSGIRRVVFGAAGPDMPGAEADLALPCREVFARTPATFEVHGPLLRDEAAVPLAGWTVRS